MQKTGVDIVERWRRIAGARANQDRVESLRELRSQITGGDSSEAAKPFVGARDQDIDITGPNVYRHDSRRLHRVHNQERPMRVREIGQQLEIVSIAGYPLHVTDTDGDSIAVNQRGNSIVGFRLEFAPQRHHADFRPRLLGDSDPRKRHRPGLGIDAYDVLSGARPQPPGDLTNNLRYARHGRYRAHRGAEQPFASAARPIGNPL